jgi:hypothetical protein
MVDKPIPKDVVAQRNAEAAEKAEKARNAELAFQRPKSDTLPPKPVKKISAEVGEPQQPLAESVAPTSSQPEPLSPLAAALKGKEDEVNALAEATAQRKTQQKVEETIALQEAKKAQKQELQSAIASVSATGAVGKAMEQAAGVKSTPKPVEEVSTVETAPADAPAPQPQKLVAEAEVTEDAPAAVAVKRGGRDNAEQKAARADIEATLNEIKGVLDPAVKVQQLFYSDVIQTDYNVNAHMKQWEAEAAAAGCDEKQTKTFIGQKVAGLIDAKQAESLQHHALANVATGAAVDMLQQIQQTALDNGIAFQTDVKYVFDGSIGERNPEKDLVEITGSYKSHNAYDKGRQDVSITIPAAYLHHDLSSLAVSVDENGKLTHGKVGHTTREQHEAKVQAFLESPEGQAVIDWQQSIDSREKLNAELTKLNAELKAQPALGEDRLLEATKFLSPKCLDAEQMPFHQEKIAAEVQAYQEKVDAETLKARMDAITAKERAQPNRVTPFSRRETPRPITRSEQEEIAAAEEERAAANRQRVRSTLITKEEQQQVAATDPFARPSKAAAQTQGVTVDDDLFAELSRVAPTANVSPDTAKIVSTSPAASQDKAQGKG